MIGKKIDQLKTREKIGLALAVIVVVAALVDRFAVRLVMGQIERIENEIRTETIQLTQNRAVMSGAPVVTAEYERIQPWLGSADTESEALDILKQRIDELARLHEIEIQAMRDRASGNEDKPWIKVAVEISRFEADVEQVVAFLFAINSQPYVWRVDRINLAPEQNGRLAGAMIIAQLTER